ncbi:MAG: heme lyase CcmF/NrfE family subunit [Ktedonobacteraceae bacterium]|nr:heme lyase CcmF/NrfE family subunit [Ktedonobacteraceae bacterium]
MYFSDLGIIALILALGFACYSVVAAVLGAVRHIAPLVESARRGVLIVTGFTLLAAAALVVSFLTRDFGVRYVAEHSSRAMSWFYTTAAFYGGQEGSLLYWALVLAIFSAIFVFTARRTPAALVPYIIAVLMSIEAFFLIVLTAASNPFVRISPPPEDGRGLNPLLLDPGMLVHPPLLLLGFMSFSLPFAFAVAAMITGRLSNEWLHAIRRWMLAAWGIQTGGLLLGAWWAYHVLGWGGYWGWDPVENAALLPWLTATAYLHSALVQERRSMLKVWNLSLVIASFALSIFGTFEVRSGIISSVHSFAYSDIGIYFFVFLVIVIVFSVGLFVFRLPAMRAEQEFDSIISREGVFLLNNLLLVGIAFAVFWGTIFPLVSSFLSRQTISVGPPFYNSVIGPLLIVLVLAMGIGPLLAWRRTSTAALWRNLSIPAVGAAICALILPLTGITDPAANVGFSVCTFTAGAIFYELWRGARVRHRHGEPYILAVYMLFNRYRQRYGGYLVHLGLVLVTAGIIGSHFFQIQQSVNLKAGQEASVAGYRLVFLGNIDYTGLPDREMIYSQVQIWREGQLKRYIYPGRTIYHNFNDQPASQIEITTFGATDLYVVLNDWKGAGETNLLIFINPLVPFIWLGGVLMLLGGSICWWPGRPQRLITARVPRATPSENAGETAPGESQEKGVAVS